MIDDLDRRLGTAFAGDLPAATSDLRGRLRAIPATPTQAGGRARRPLLLVAAAATLALVGAIALSSGTPPVPTPSVGPSDPSAPSSQMPSPTPIATRAADSAMTVTELAAARLAGTIAGEVVRVRGYWSDASSSGNCGRPDADLAVLEAALIGCDSSNLRGLTEFEEPLWRGASGARDGAIGPSLKPHVDDALLARLQAATDPAVPTPVVLSGHFDDPRAEECRNFTREDCRQRFVLDDVIAVGADATPTPTSARDDPAIWTIGELLEARIGGRIGGETVVLRGFWSDLNLVHTCAPSMAEPTALEWDRCSIGERGMTQLEEPIGRVTVDFRLFNARGPSIAPLFPQEPLEELYEEMARLDPEWFQHPTLWPITVEGHFDDPRAQGCTVYSLEWCRNRFVVTRVVRLEAPLSGSAPSAPPSPFPFGSPPPPPFTADRCFGDIEYSFVGWGRLPDVGVVDFDPGVVYMMVTAEEQDLGRGRFNRRVCYALEYDIGVVGFATIP